MILLFIRGRLAQNVSLIENGIMKSLKTNFTGACPCLKKWTSSFLTDLPIMCYSFFVFFEGLMWSRSEERRKHCSWSSGSWQWREDLFLKSTRLCGDAATQEACTETGSYQWVSCPVSESILLTDLLSNHPFDLCSHLSLSPMWSISKKSPVWSQADNWLHAQA